LVNVSTAQALNERLLVDGDLDHLFLHRADDGLADIKCREEVFFGCALIPPSAGFEGISRYLQGSAS
jgi:hypothetical protein